MPGLSGVRFAFPLRAVRCIFEILCARGKERATGMFNAVILGRRAIARQVEVSQLMLVQSVSVSLFTLKWSLAASCLLAWIPQCMRSRV